MERNKTNIVKKKERTGKCKALSHAKTELVHGMFRLAAFKLMLAAMFVLGVHLEENQRIACITCKSLPCEQSLLRSS